LEKGRVYNVLLKLRKGDIYMMIADKQKSFTFSSFDDYSFEKLFNDVVGFLEATFEEYTKEIGFSCDSVLFDFWPVVVGEEIRKIANLDSLNGNFSKREIAEVRRDSNLFGLSIDGIEKAIPLVVILGREKEKVVIKEILNMEYMLDVDIKRFVAEFTSNQFKLGVNKHNYHLNEKSEFSLVQHNKRSYIIISDRGNTFGRVEQDTDNIIVHKRCFNLYGSFISEISEVLSGDGNILRREKGSLVTEYSNNEIVYSERKIKFESIKKDYKVKVKSVN
jgi:hypothetical protein